MSVNHRLHPLMVVGLALLVAAALDAAIYRSQLYSRVATIHSAQGLAAHFVAFEKKRSPSGKKEVLLVGHSKMEHAFELPTFEKDFPDSDLLFVKGCKAGTTLKSWYYLLRKIDPTHNRYAAIVLPLEGYLATPREEDPENSIEDLQVLASLLSPDEWHDFLAADTNPMAIHKAWLFALSPSHAFSQDLQDLLITYDQRLADIRRNLENAMLEPGLSDPYNMLELRYDATTGKVLSYPSRFTSFQRNETDNVLRVPNEDPTVRAERNLAYNKRWAEKFIEAYRSSRTKLIFVYMPHQAVPMATHTPLPGAPDIRAQISHDDNVYFLDDTPYKQIEQPDYFQDTLHLNHEGAQVFTTQLTHDIEALLKTEKQVAPVQQMKED